MSAPLLTPEQAQAIVLQEIPLLGVERVLLFEALGRVLAEGVAAQRRRLKLRLLGLLGAQKIDLVVAQDMSRPFVKIARQQGIRLMIQEEYVALQYLPL